MLKKILFTIISALTISIPFLPASSISGPIRLVVIPGYVESGDDLFYDEEVLDHYRRTMRFINNQLVKHGFEVINPVAKDLNSEDHTGLIDRSASVARSICERLTEKYETDAAYVIWLDIFARRTPDGFCEVQARVDGEGYDAAGRDLGAGLAKDFTTVQEECVEAVEMAEKEIGTLVGRVLTAGNS